MAGAQWGTNSPGQRRLLMLKICLEITSMTLTKDLQHFFTNLFKTVSQ